MNELEHFLREHRDKPLANHPPSPEKWEQLQERLATTEPAASFFNRKLFLLGLAFLISLLLVLVLVALNTETKHLTTAQHQDTEQVAGIPFDNKNSPEQKSDVPLGVEPETATAPVEIKWIRTDQLETKIPLLRKVVSGVPTPPLATTKQAPEQLLATSTDASFHSTKNELTFAPSTNLTDAAVAPTDRSTTPRTVAPLKLDNSYLAFDGSDMVSLQRSVQQVARLETKTSLLLLGIRPNLAERIDPLRRRKFRFTARFDVGLLMGEGGTTAIAQPIVTEPAPGQNLWVQLLPDGSPVYVASEGEEVALEWSAAPWYRLNLGLIYREHWHLGLEVAYGSLAKQRIDPAFRSPDERFYTVFAREQQSWLFGPSVAYGSRLNNWNWSVGVTGLIQTWSASQYDRRLVTPNEQYSSLFVSERGSTRQFVPVIDLRTSYQLTPHWSIGPSFAILPLKRKATFPADWPDEHNWWSGQVGIFFRW